MGNACSSSSSVHPSVDGNSGENNNGDPPSDEPNVLDTFSRRERQLIRDTWSQLDDARDTIADTMRELLEAHAELKPEFGVKLVPAATVLQMPKVSAHVKSVNDLLETVGRIYGFVQFSADEHTRLPGQRDRRTADAAQNRPIARPRRLPARQCQSGRGTARLFCGIRSATARQTHARPGRGRIEAGGEGGRGCQQARALLARVSRDGGE